MADCCARLVPVALESQGRCGGLAQQELSRLARMKGTILAGDPTAANAVARASIRRWRRWIAVTLQKGNAAMVMAALGQPQPAAVDGDLLQAAGDVHSTPLWALSG